MAEWLSGQGFLPAVLVAGALRFWGCLVFIDGLHVEVFLTQICVHYLAVFLASVKLQAFPLPLVPRSPEAQQRVGGCFLNLMPQMRTLYLAYCANHPSAVNVLTEHRYVQVAAG